MLSTSFDILSSSFDHLGASSGLMLSLHYTSLVQGRVNGRRSDTTSSFDVLIEGQRKEREGIDGAAGWVSVRSLGR